ncbi:MAG: hypothetical protein RIS35_1577 [Pseudomonadota bacterium]|jgi:glycosyltransferase involved in cell wall biosynthesis
MKILFVHQNFPGQFKHLAPALAAAGHEVVALGINQTRAELPGVQHYRYKVKRGTTPNVHPWVGDFETKTIRGEACARACAQLKERGFVPDVVYAHPGWGEALFLKDVFPAAKLVGFFEFYYHGQGGDANFDPEFPRPPFDEMRVRAKNAANLLSLEACDVGVCPTEWQKSVHPEEYKHKLQVVFDGIDTDALRPDPDAKISLADKGLTLSARDEVITFVNRNLEPYRGWHVFARTLPEILRRRPKAQVLIVGGDEVSYGAKPKDGISFRQRYWEEVASQVDASRVHFLGKLPYAQFTRVLQVSGAHVYLTYPFVLSWSTLEAMSLGALVIGSRTPPVEEVIRDGENGLMVDFFDRNGIADAVDRVFEHPDRMQALRDAARRTAVERYDLKRICLPRQLEIIERLVATAQD